eukprot:gnl/TRDRNA2_/TRDRNA2_137067_c0_seq1.p1 gnl/TRDRNA2_/TRDRNA2_137067_c0~~gnl/TRDRNA2_/TRDRNA2_137067_c0_seq1.p1  ORF type:complete len:274 (+),score=38.99 gnl/TRDRNA2_/TRDRNA2_137067_c0_seq1:62-823(+)
MRVVVVPVLSDNYAYLLIDDATKQAACVDPVEAHMVVAAAKKEGVSLVAVLTTHHHYDHAGGNSEMKNQVAGIKVYGGQLDNVQACTDFLQHDNVFTIGSIQVRALHTPGHTKGSISYYCTEGSSKAVFTGDTLFVGGCGRIFESTAAELYRSLSDVLGKLPAETEVYVGHEYTVKNLEFAVTVDKENQNLANMLKQAREKRLERSYTVPSTMQNEYLINPFLRAAEPTMQSICPGCSPVDVFTQLRKQKDSF